VLGEPARAPDETDAAAAAGRDNRDLVDANVANQKLQADEIAALKAEGKVRCWVD
jgi:hypothetical protein